MEPIFNRNDYVAGIKYQGAHIQSLHDKICIVSTEPIINESSDLKNILIDKNRKLNILVIEDDPIAQKAMRLMLAHETNCEIDQVYSFTEALKRVGNRYDIIFSDIHLPDGLGTDFCIAYRKQFQVVPIIAVTAHATEDDVLLMIEEGFTDVLSKPFDLELLKLMIASYVFEKDHSED